MASESAPIGILTPSRGRPDSIGKLVESLEQAGEGLWQLYVSIGGEDAARYPRLPGVRYVVNREPPLLVAATNEIAQLAAPNHRVLGFLGDDHRPRTPGWDRLILDAFDAMGSGLVWAADGLMDGRFPTAPFLSASIVREFGWFWQPSFTHLNADVIWAELASAVGHARFLPDVLIEHMHPAAGKAENDETYAIANSPEMVARDGGAYNAYKTDPDGFDRDVRRLAELIAREAHA